MDVGQVSEEAGVIHSMRGLLQQLEGEEAWCDMLHSEFEFMEDSTRFDIVLMNRRKRTDPSGKVSTCLCWKNYKQITI